MVVYQDKDRAIIKLDNEEIDAMLAMLDSWTTGIIAENKISKKNFENKVENIVYGDALKLAMKMMTEIRMPDDQ